MSLEEMPLPPPHSKCAETYQALAATHALDGEGKISHHGLSLVDVPLGVEMAETAAECATLGVLTYTLPVLTYSSSFFGKKTKREAVEEEVGECPGDISSYRKLLARLSESLEPPSY